MKFFAVAFDGDGRSLVGVGVVVALGDGIVTIVRFAGAVLKELMLELEAAVAIEAVARNFFCAGSSSRASALGDGIAVFA